tara:strand:- start:2491 stop:3084 length:594 start_codon:yes stop_codon:yes gene_type:complete
MTRTVLIRESLKAIADFAYAIRFLKLLVTPFEKTDAFKLGVIDAKGKVLKKGKERKTREEKDSYTVFHRLVFNLKKIIPLGKLGSYASALFLIREHTGMSDEEIENALDKADLRLDDFIHESSHYVTDFEELKIGTYILKDDLCHTETGEDIFKKGTKIRVDEHTIPVGKVFDINIFEAKHIPTGMNIYVSQYNIER